MLIIAVPSISSRWVKDFTGNSDVCTSVVTVLMNGPSERPGLVKQDTSGHNSKQALKLKASPNPSVGDVLVEFELPFAQPFKLRVFDMTGQANFIQQQMGAAGKNSVLLRRELFLPGVYFLNLQLKGAHANKRLIIRN